MKELANHTNERRRLGTTKTVVMIYAMCIKQHMSNVKISGGGIRLCGPNPDFLDQVFGGQQKKYSYNRLLTSPPPALP